MPLSHLIFKSRKRRLFGLSTASGMVLLLIGGAFYSQLPAQELRDEHEIAPGLSVLSVQTSIPQGRLKYWLIKADRKRWNPGLQVANAQDVTLKRTVRSFAILTGAPVAINGGFFAYAGAAVGAVKVGGQWHRLPWKSRTAMGWNEKDARIDSLSGLCQLTLTGGDGAVRQEEAALNGFTLAGRRAQVTNGFVVLTPQFAPKYQFRGGEVAALVQSGQIVSRTIAGVDANSISISIPKDGFLLVARGTSAAQLQSTVIPTAWRTATWKVMPSPGDWDGFDTILGAGPRLVRDGVPTTTEVEEEFQMDVRQRGPRTCVGWDANHNWLFFVADGWRQESEGLTLAETGKLFQTLGAVQAMNLDGGASTQLVINQEQVNLAREVPVSNALVFKPR